MLNSKQRAFLRGLANRIDTILIVGKGEITDNIIKQADDALTAREIIKGKVLENARINIEVSETGGITEAELTAVFDKAETPERIKVSWKFPAVDCYSTWSPSIRDDHSIQPNWAPRRTSRELARWMPLHGILSIGGENRLLIAVSDALRPIEIETGINEFDSCLDCSVTFFTRPTAPLSSYSTVIRLD